MLWTLEMVFFAGFIFDLLSTGQSVSDAARMLNTLPSVEGRPADVIYDVIKPTGFRP